MKTLDGMRAACPKDKHEFLLIIRSPINNCDINADISVAFQDVHNQEIKKFGGETIEAPKQLRFKDGGGDLVVELKSLRPGWTSEDDANVSVEYLSWNYILTF